MTREASILKSFVTSAIFSAIMIALALHMEWGIVDLSKCFFITVAFSTITICFAFIFSIASSFPNAERPSELSNIWKVILYIVLLGGSLFLASRTIPLHEWLHDELASSVEGWEPRSESEENLNWLFELCLAYLPFTALLIIKMVYSFNSLMKRQYVPGLNEGMRFVLYGHTFLILILVLTLKFLTPSLETEILYIVLVVIIFLPWQELLSSLGRLHGGY